MNNLISDSDKFPLLRYLIYSVLLTVPFIFRDFTPSNELRYISIVEESLRDGTWFTFHNHGEAYADKPPLFFWLMKLARLIGGNQIWILGLFSVLPAVGVVAVMDRWMAQTYTSHNPLASNLMLLTTTLFLGSALVVRMDMLMVLFIVLALYTFFRMYQGRAKSYDKWMLPVYIFMALFTKGPVGLIVPVVSIALFLGVNKQLSTFGRYLGWRQWAIILALCGSWFACIYTEGGSGYLNNILFKQTVGRGVNSFAHKEPFWFYIPRLLWTFAPWTLLYLTAAVFGVRQKVFSGDLEKFFACIICSTVILLSLISSKLDIYLLPVYPFAVYLCAAILHRNPNNMAVRISAALPAFILILALPLLWYLSQSIPSDYGRLTIPYIAAAVATVGGAAGLYYIFRLQTYKAIVFSASGILLLIAIGSFAIPQVNHLFGLKALAGSAQSYVMYNPGKEVDYAYYKFRGGADMDVYLGVSPEDMETMEKLRALESAPHPTILFIMNRQMRREPELREWLSDKTSMWEAGEYRWYLIEGAE